MTEDQAVNLVRSMRKAHNEAALTELIALHLPRFDGLFFGVLNRSVEQLKQEGKPQIATALENSGGTSMRMRWLI